MYASVDDLRLEGVEEAQASDSRLEDLLEEASRSIDRLTGWYFVPRTAKYRLDGRGTPTLEPPAPPIRIAWIRLLGAPIPVGPSSLVVVGAPVEPGFDGPRITLRGGWRFPRGEGNVEVAGRWGYTEPDGTREGRTPLAIRRACILLALRWLPLMGDADAAAEARDRWRLIEERTRDQSYKLAPGDAAGPLTGDPEIDALLLPFLRPTRKGAA
jgi:hypothetical protein